MPVASARPQLPSSLRGIERELREEANREVHRTLQVGVLLALGYREGEVAERLQIKPAAVMAAKERLRGASARAEGYDQPA